MRGSGGGESRLGNSKTPNLCHPSNQWMVVSDQFTEDSLSGLEVVLPFNNPSIHSLWPTSCLPHTQSKSIRLTPSYPFQLNFSNLPKPLGGLNVLLCAPIERHPCPYYIT